MSRLYSKNEKRVNELSESQKRVERLSIEYNPLNQIRKDLQLSTYKDEKDMNNMRELLTVQMLAKKFGTDKRIVMLDSIIQYCIMNNYSFRKISEYRSELTDKSLEAIQKFTQENNIDIRNSRDNFYILAPLKYFNKDNMDLSNVSFNIYYRDGYINVPKLDDNFVEIYGSDFNYSKNGVFNEIFNGSSSNERLFSKSYLILMIITTFLFFCAYLVLVFNCGVGKSFLVSYNVAMITLYLMLLYRYNKEFGNKEYISKINYIDQVLNNGKFKI